MSGTTDFGNSLRFCAFFSHCIIYAAAGPEPLCFPDGYQDAPGQMRKFFRGAFVLQNSQKSFPYGVIFWPVEISQPAVPVSASRMKGPLLEVSVTSGRCAHQPAERHL